MSDERLEAKHQIKLDDVLSKGLFEKTEESEARNTSKRGETGIGH